LADDALEKNLDETHDRVHAEIKLVEERRAKLGALRQAGNAFPNDFRRDDVARIFIASMGIIPTKCLKRRYGL